MSASMDLRYSCDEILAPGPAVVRFRQGVSAVRTEAGYSLVSPTRRLPQYFRRFLFGKTKSVPEFLQFPPFAFRDYSAIQNVVYLLLVFLAAPMQLV